jgi:hypothetical protein
MEMLGLDLTSGERAALACTLRGIDLRFNPLGLYRLTILFR